MFISPGLVSVCSLDADLTVASMVNLRTIRFEEPTQESLFSATSYAVVCVTAPLFEAVRVALSESLGDKKTVRFIQVELMSITRDCVAALAEVGDGYFFTIHNFRRPFGCIALFSVVPPVKAEPVSFQLGWQSLLEPEESDLIDGETFQKLLEFCSVTVCLSSGALLDFFPLLPIAHDLKLPSRFAKHLDFLATFSSEPFMGIGQYDGPSILKSVVTLARIGSRHFDDVRFFTPDLPCPAGSVIIVPVYDRPTTLSAPTRIGVSLGDGFFCTAAVANGKSSLYFSGLSGLPDVDQVSLDTDIEASCSAKREHQRTLITHNVLDFEVVTITPVCLPSGPALVVFSAKDVYCLPLSLLKEGYMSKLEHKGCWSDCRSALVVIPNGRSPWVEVWDPTQPESRRIDLTRAYKVPELQGGASPQSTPRSKRSSTWLTEIVSQLDRWRADSLTSAAATNRLEVFLAELREQDQTALSVVESAMQQLGPGGEIPPILQRRKQYCEELAARIKTYTSLIVDGDHDLQGRLKTIKEIGANIESEFNRLKEDMIATIIDSANQGIEWLLEPGGGGILGNPGGWIKGPSFSALLSALRSVIPTASSNTAFLNATMAVGATRSIVLRSLHRTPVASYLNSIEIQENLESKYIQLKEILDNIDQRLDTFNKTQSSL
eukprot:Protomagalhaensia_sp_Gyna_25__3992@NODE_359_length_3740_cov_212_002972_g277_i0_p1_GENE_NODE_359_length_3740_cov_212_002972_g277_i0NODE_359_length_3740_cov_212_002972_g277_i0_p1_ORF_typecomplete_len663_score64_66_NODE_359_length_3740_cov_212_002972_g277_i015373525